VAAAGERESTRLLVRSATFKKGISLKKIYVAVAANMLSNYESMFRKAGIAEADCAFNMWSEDRFPATAPTLADFLNWMPSTATQDAGDAEELQESVAFAATSQGI
jgi:hypothetical protein